MACGLLVSANLVAAAGVREFLVLLGSSRLCRTDPHLLVSYRPLGHTGLFFIDGRPAVECAKLKRAAALEGEIIDWCDELDKRERVKAPPTAALSPSVKIVTPSINWAPPVKWPRAAHE